MMLHHCSDKPKIKIQKFTKLIKSARIDLLKVNIIALLLSGVSIVADYQFTLYSASTLAACSIAAALRGLGLDGQLPRLHELTRIDLVNTTLVHFT